MNRLWKSGFAQGISLTARGGGGDDDFSKLHVVLCLYFLDRVLSISY